MAIEPGQTVPSVTLKHMNDDGIKDFRLGELLEGKKVILFGVPGAYTPVCSTQHLPGYIEQYERLRAEGVDAIGCIAVNDPFVMSEWGKLHGANGKVLMLCDPEAELTTALGLDLDLTAFGLGTRSKRYSMVVENGVAKSVNVEASIFDHESSAATSLLADEPS